MIGGRKGRKERKKKHNILNEQRLWHLLSVNSSSFLFFKTDLDYLVDTLRVFAAVVHLGLGALVEVGDTRNRVQRAVDEQTTVTDVIVSSLKISECRLSINSYFYFFVSVCTYSHGLKNENKNVIYFHICEMFSQQVSR